MLSKFELVGISVSVLFMAMALYLIRVETSVFGVQSVTRSQTAGLADSAIIAVQSGEDINQQRANAILKAADGTGNIKKLVIDDIKVGTGEAVKEGDTVSVNYVGTLQNGYEFDNSYKRGEPFEFKVGEGRVIKGWEQGLVGMKVGGQRVLVIPPDLAYGKTGIGPIPGNATLVFAIDLLEIK